MANNGVTSQINDQALAFLSVFAQTFPQELPRAVPLNLNFAAIQTFALSIQNTESRDFISMVQALYVDNSQNSVQLTIAVSSPAPAVTSGGNTQRIIVPAYYQGYVNVLANNPASFVFTTTGTAIVPIQLLNFPVTNCMWPAAVPGSGGTVTTNVVYSGGVNQPAQVMNYTLTTSAGITNSVSPLLSPANGYMVGGMALMLTSNATLTAGTDLQVTLSDSVSGQIAVVNLSPANGINSYSLGITWNNKTAASTLSLNMSTSLSAGKLYYTIPYALTSWVG